MLVNLLGFGCVSPLTALPLSDLAVKAKTSVFDPITSTYKELNSLVGQEFISYGVSTTRARTYYITQKGIEFLTSLD